MIRTGAQYMEGLKAPRLEGLEAPSEAYVGGERVEDVTKFPAFRRPIESYARVYDMKHADEF